MDKAEGRKTCILTELGVAEDSGGFKEMMRMGYETFVNLLSLIEKDANPFFL